MKRIIAIFLSCCCMLSVALTPVNAMRVQHNMTAMNANRQLSITTGAQAK